ncbi:hypothetical protein KIN20_035868 [Parelaphostrongylus tenuis]|uniref:Uncharacterized protein n=1 Tax=Parelaphostrongylus tenuis TaxID=148309 RepID=A0AAD5RC63_PARTN|nr:hypothetical protein KIN20_035868 [Parelaphostrongylus tenuis]
MIRLLAGARLSKSLLRLRRYSRLNHQQAPESTPTFQERSAEVLVANDHRPHIPGLCNGLGRHLRHRKGDVDLRISRTITVKAAGYQQEVSLGVLEPWTTHHSSTGRF